MRTAIGTGVAQTTIVGVAYYIRSNLNVEVRSMKRVSILTSLFCICLAGTLMGQFDPHGSLDTVSVGDALVAPSGSFSLPVKLVNDEEVSAFSIPLNYDKSCLVFDSVSFVNSRVANWSFAGATHNEAAGTILLGGLSIDDLLLPAGSGSLAGLHFHPVPGAEAGRSAAIDSAFVPPAGEFIITAFDNTSMIPVFLKGSVTISDAELPPQFVPIPGKVVNEGDTLAIAVNAADPEGAAVKLAGEKLPPGASFTDNGDGSGNFVFVAPFVGPGSASQSPLQVRFAASDGAAVAYQDVEIDVVNVNRPPQFTGGLAVTAAAGDSVYLPLLASDPDYERVTLYCSSLPSGAELSDASPGFFSWVSGIADSGSHSITVTAVDESGGSTSRDLSVMLSPTVPIELSISEAQAFTSSPVEVEISMHNRVDISAYHLLINFDQTALSLQEVTSEGTRIEDWQSLSSMFSEGDGFLWISAEADTLDMGAASLAIGEGSVARLRFITTGDLGLGGHYSRISFTFIDADSVSENFFYMPDSTLIGYRQITYEQGGVLLKTYDALVGDINLNGIPFEVGDMVYFSNYFVDPFEYPLDGARWPNSDINQDGQPGTLADLLYMQSIIDGENPGKASVTTESLHFSLNEAPDGYGYHLDGPSDLSAALLKFALLDGGTVAVHPAAALAGVDVKIGCQDDTLRVLLLAGGSHAVNADGEELFHLSGSSCLRLVDQQFVDAYGREVTAKDATAALSLPTDFTLDQNYPNPFNPQTTISFGLPEACQASLEVYNVLGKKVRTVVDGYLSAGRHQVLFDGRDGDGRELPSGVYFYRLRTSDFEDSRKMLLLK